MKIKMELLSDVIFGNGMSIPGAEDISVLVDENGFPYYKGGTFKGIVREEYARYLEWTGIGKAEIDSKIDSLFGNSGANELGNKLVFSDFTLSPYVKKTVLDEIDGATVVTDVLTNVRTFTAIDDSGIVKQGSLRMARCVNKGLFFYSDVTCDAENAPMLAEVIESIKWIGSMRNRGFGKVKFTVEEDK